MSKQSDNEYDKEQQEWLFAFAVGIPAGLTLSAVLIYFFG